MNTLCKNGLKVEMSFGVGAAFGVGEGWAGEASRGLLLGWCVEL